MSWRRKGLGVWALGVALATGCGPKTLQARMKSGEEGGEKAGAVLDDAEHAMDKEQVDRAEDRIHDAKKILSDPDVQYYPEREMLQGRIADDEARLVKVRQVIAQRILDEAVAKQTKAVDDASAALKKAIDDLRLPGLSATQVKAARQAAESVGARLDEGKDLEAKDKGYAQRGKVGRKAMEDAITEIRQSERTVAFLEGTGPARKEATDADAQIPKTKDAHKRLELMKTARDKFKACADEAKKQLLATPELKKSVIVLEESITAPEGILDECISRGQAEAKPIAELEKIVAILDGPGAARKHGQDLAKGSDAETDPAKKLEGLKGALTAFKTCITQSKKLALRYRDLKKTEIELDDGTRLTPDHLTADCVQRGTSLDKSIAAAAKAARAAAKAKRK